MRKARQDRNTQGNVALIPVRDRASRHTRICFPHCSRTVRNTCLVCLLPALPYTSCTCIILTYVTDLLDGMEILAP